MAPAPTLVVEPGIGDPVVLVSRERDLSSSEVFFELVGSSCADNRDTGERLLVHEPSQRYLGGRGVDLVGDCPNLVEDFPAALREIESLEPLVETPTRPVGSPDRFRVVRIGAFVFSGEEAAS